MASVKPELIIAGIDYKPLALHDGTVYRVVKVSGPVDRPTKATCDYIAYPMEKSCRSTLAEFAERVSPALTRHRREAFQEAD